MLLRWSSLGTVLLLAGSAVAQAADAPKALIVYSAASMKGALGAVLKRFSAETGREVALSSGPAGVMLEKRGVLTENFG